MTPKPENITETPDVAADQTGDERAAQVPQDQGGGVADVISAAVDVTEIVSGAVEVVGSVVGGILSIFE